MKIEIENRDQNKRSFEEFKKKKVIESNIKRKNEKRQKKRQKKTKIKIKKEEDRNKIFCRHTNE